MFIFITALLVSEARAEVPTVSLDDAVHRAESTFSVSAADDGVAAAKARLSSTRTARLPSINVSGNVLAYDGEQTFSLISSDTPIDCSTFPESFAALCEGFGQETVVREQVTSSITVRVVEPLTAQFAIDRQVAAARAGAEASEASLDAAVADARYTALDAWYSAVQAEQQLAIAEAQVRSLEARVKTAEASNAAGMLTRNDLLLASIALAQAKQGALQLAAYRDLAYGRLGVAVGTDGDPVRPAEAPETPPRAPPDTDALLARALQSRPDLVAMRLHGDAAHDVAQATSWGRLPSISLLGSYTHQEGQGLFADPDTAYVGATLDWNPWAWGKAAADTHAAQASASQVQHQLDAMEAGVRLEVQSRASALSTAIASWTLAETTVQQAQENLNIQEKRQAGGTATMQEVLDAELTLARAQSTRASALFDAHRAEAALQRAIGGDPWG